MKYISSVVILIFLGFQCSIEELPPLGENQYLLDGIDIVTVDTIWSTPAGANFQAVRMHFTIDLSNVKEEHLDKIHKISLMRDSVTLTKGLNLMADTYFGSSQYKRGETYVFSFGAVDKDLRPIIGGTKEFYYTVP